MIFSAAFFCSSLRAEVTGADPVPDEDEDFIAPATIDWGLINDKPNSKWPPKRNILYTNKSRTNKKGFCDFIFGRTCFFAFLV